MRSSPFPLSINDIDPSKIIGKASHEIDAETKSLLMSIAGQKKHNELDDSSMFDLAAHSDDERVQAAVGFFYTEMCRALGMTFRHTIAIKHLNALLLNLYRVYLISPNYHLSYIRQNGGYAIPERYNPQHLTSKSLANQVDGLAKLMQVDPVKGFHNSITSIGRVSRVQAISVLIDQLENDFGFSPELARHRIPAEPIQLKGEKGLIDYRESDETVRMREHVRVYNQILSEADIRLSPEGEKLYEQLCALQPTLREVDFSRFQVHRVFNRGKFTCLGRFYGPWWQVMKNRPIKKVGSADQHDWPGGLRKHIIIDGEPTVECDYSAMHIHLLYSEKGINYHELYDDGDPYLIGNGDPEFRKVVKQIFLSAISANTIKEGLGASRKELKSQEGMCLSNKELEIAFDRIKNKHSQIEEYLFSDAGIHLQRLDSDIADYVHCRMLERGIVVLSVHDSFIVQAKHHDELVEVMKETFDALGHISKPKIKSTMLS